MPKSDRSGQAAILSTEELDALMQLLPPFYRALFQTARFSAGRINEVLHLKWSNVYPDCIIIPKAITKKKVRTREIPLHPILKDELAQWRAKWPEVFGRAIEGSMKSDNWQSSFFTVSSTSIRKSLVPSTE